MYSIFSLIGRKLFKNFYLCLLVIILLTVFTYKTLKSRSRSHTDDVYQPQAIFSDSVIHGHMKRDWNDYRRMHNEELYEGLGAHGQPAVLTDEKDPKIGEVIYKLHGYNGALSDRISGKRSLPDIRPKECLAKKYLIDLPKASIILTLYNEHLSVLMRSIDSVFNRTPLELIKDFIIVDDGSTDGKSLKF